MRARERIRSCFLLSGLMIGACSVLAAGQTDPAAAKPAPPAATQRDGQHDFDFELGSWKIHLKRRLNPLTGSNTWVDFDGT